MANLQDVKDIKDGTERKAREASENSWVKGLARLGYAAKGAVYATVGILAIQAALGRGGATTGSEGALRTIASQPFGTLLLVIVGVGLLGYALWRFVEAVVDPSNKGTDAMGLAQRVGYVVRGLIYAGLALAAFQIVVGATSGGSSNGPEAWTERILAWPLGAWLVGLGGLIVIGAGLQEAYSAYKGDFREELKLEELNHDEEEWVTRVGSMGLAARAVVFLLMGLFLIRAAMQHDASEAGGLDQALQTLARQPYGPWLLGIVAVGMIAYSIFMFVKAKYIRLPS